MAKFSEDGGAGTAVAAAPAPAATSAAAPASSPAAAAPAATAPSAAATPAPAPASGNPPPASAPAAPVASPAHGALDSSKGPLLFQMPERGTPEYWSKFDELPFEQRQQLEREQQAFARGELKRPDAPPDPAAAPLPGDTPPAAAPADEVGLDDSMLSTLRGALPPEHQPMLDRVTRTVEAMQSQLEKVAPYFSEQFEQGMGLFMQDPIIAGRMNELQSGNPFKPAEIESLSLDTNGLLSGSKLMEIDPAVNPEGFQTELSGLLQKAFEQGARGGYLKAEYVGNEKAALEKRVSSIMSGIDALMNKPGNEALRPSDSSIKIGSDKHPLNPFIQWVRDPALGDAYLEKVGVEAAYMTFLASTGKVQQAFKNVEERTRLTFFKKVQEAARSGQNLSNVSNSVPANSHPELPGIDTSRYLKDQSYARDIFERADDKTRTKLERLRVNGTLT